MTQAATDSNLLFGILALQLDFITRDELIAAMQSWVLAKQKALGEILVEQAALTEEERTLLEPVVRMHLANHGDDPRESLSTLSGLQWVGAELKAITDPELLVSLEQLGGSASTRDPGATGSFTSLGSSLHPGRFRILRPHARGGLGEVFVARDEELRREVALKQIQDRYAEDLQSRARFVLEAEVTGGLEHPGIVPVYGLGTDAGGRPYYAMRLIRGDSLKEAIERFHRADGPGRDSGKRTLEQQRLLRRFIDACNAVAYAHSRGILHRDLKPANVMLGPFGETLVVNWGLAKPIGRARTTAPVPPSRRSCPRPRAT